MNKVIAGEFENCVITTFNNEVKISTGFNKGRIIDFTTIKQYEVVTEENQKSMSSGIMRGIAGGMLLGGVGAVAGAVSGKNKGTFTIAIEFVDGKKSLIEVDNNTYKMILTKCFDSGKPKLTAEELLENDNMNSKKNKKKNKVALVFFLFALSLLLITVISVCSSSDTETQKTVQSQ